MRFQALAVQYLNSSGQSLLEITVAIGVAVLVVSALTITTIVGLRNSQFSQNQIQATKLAQEGLETIRSMRDINNPICVGVSPQTQYKWLISDSPNVWVDWDLTASKNLYIGLPPGCRLLDTIAEKPISGTIFTRKVTAINYQNINQKQFTVEVSWQDSTGTHKSQLSTILTNH